MGSSLRLPLTRLSESGSSIDAAPASPGSLDSDLIDLRTDAKEGTEFLSMMHPPFQSSVTFGNSEHSKHHFRILSLDGGGVKGIMPAIILSSLEKELRDEVKLWQKAEQLSTSNNPNPQENNPRVQILQSMKVSAAADTKTSVENFKNLLGTEGDVEKLRIADFFDLIAGTSTGGLMSAFLTARASNGEIPKASQLAEHYENLSRKVFPPSEFSRRASWLTWKKGWWGALSRGGYCYDVEPLETYLKDILGQTKASDTVKPCVIPTFSFDTSLPQIWETGIPRGGIDREGLKRTKLWEVCRATSAAPTYFKPAEVIREVLKEDSRPGDHLQREPILERYLDGGLFANNPIFFAYRWPFSNRGEVLKQLSIPESYIPSQKNILILSLGCGEAKVDKERKEKEGSPEDWRLLQWAKKSTGLAMAGTGYSPDLAMFFPYLTCARMPCYLRLQPVIAAELEPMDRADSIEGLATRVREYLTRERGHRGYPFASSYDKNSMPRAPLTKFLSESYFGSSPDEEDSKVWELLKETNGQSLARFAQLLVREWVLRRLNGADFGVNVPSRSQA